MRRPRHAHLLSLLLLASHPADAQLRGHGGPVRALAISADGARYVGDHWQWWTKGMHDAWLSPLRNGETYPSASGVACRAP